MVLIANKPCSFGGKRFFIGDEIPEELVLSPLAQQKLGVLTIKANEPKKPEPVKAAPEKAPAKKGKAAKAAEGAGEA